MDCSQVKSTFHCEKTDHKEHVGIDGNISSKLLFSKASCDDGGNREILKVM